MKNILVINSSISGDKGHSHQLSRQFIDSLPTGSFTVQEIDVNTLNLPHLDMPEIAAWMADPAKRTAEQQKLVAISDGLIAQVKAADVIVIGVPMYNFAIPSQLKAFLDRLARAGITFRYTEQGSLGLLADKPVVILAARGGLYQGTPADSQTPFLTMFFNFIGLKDLHFVYAEGLNMGNEAATKALSAAKNRLAELGNTLAA